LVALILAVNALWGQHYLCRLVSSPVTSLAYELRVGGKIVRYHCLFPRQDRPSLRIGVGVQCTSER